MPAFQRGVQRQGPPRAVLSCRFWHPTLDPYRLHKGLDSSGGGVGTGVSARYNDQCDDGIEYGPKCFDISELESEDEWSVACETSQFGSPKSKVSSVRDSVKKPGLFHSRGRNNDRAKSFKLVPKRAWVVLVMGANVTSSISGYTTDINNHVEDDEANDSERFHETKNELDLSVSPDPEEVDGGNAN
ncbi:uncharacterized protein BP5553_03328 [Venustampulla echinocandica]|uniref:Uncharacterized protein n=1 Tax=Venustampulla echinocandica TaxID=2656787 RepID=A0A370TU18_9HELO|nr:uncharacterized protein BP5553_03328 [Venustampulla echinocandica]RDL38988.1 hypothetical protein BP5553_03328 [Venustampulla echinocandica]